MEHFANAKEPIDGGWASEILKTSWYMVGKSPYNLITLW